MQMSQLGLGETISGKVIAIESDGLMLILAGKHVLPKKTLAQAL